VSTHTQEGTWFAGVPIPLFVAEGPLAFAALENAKARVRQDATQDGVDPQGLTWKLVKPEAVAGVPVTQGVDPIYGTPIPAPYTLTAHSGEPHV
jgi:hypothetical protein